MKGAKPIFDKDPAIKIVSDQAANWDATKAHDITATVLQQNPDLCGIYGFWDVMSAGRGDRGQGSQHAGQGVHLRQR